MRIYRKGHKCRKMCKITSIQQMRGRRNRGQRKWGGGEGSEMEDRVPWGSKEITDVAKKKRGKSGGWRCCSWATTSLVRTNESTHADPCYSNGRFKKLPS